MKGKFYLFLFGIMLLGSAFVSAQDVSEEMTVKANVLATETGISVPDEVVFRSIAAGYKSERKDLEIKNVGTTDVTIRPELSESDNETVFNYLTFKTTVSGDEIKIGLFDFEIEKPDLVGDIEEQQLYMHLDLTNYDGEISEDNSGEQNATVIFTAMPN